MSFKQIKMKRNWLYSAENLTYSNYADNLLLLKKQFVGGTSLHVNANLKKQSYTLNEKEPSPPFMIQSAWVAEYNNYFSAEV